MIKFTFYYMTNCPACNIAKPTIESLKKEFISSKEVFFEDHNVSNDNWAEATRKGVESTPTVHIYYEDALLEFAEGPMPLLAYRSMIERQLRKLDTTKLNLQKQKHNAKLNQ